VVRRDRGMALAEDHGSPADQQPCTRLNLWSCSTFHGPGWASYERAIRWVPVSVRPPGGGGAATFYDLARKRLPLDGCLSSPLYCVNCRPRAFGPAAELLASCGRPAVRSISAPSTILRRNWKAMLHCRRAIESGGKHGNLAMGGSRNPNQCLSFQPLFGFGVRCGSLAVGISSPQGPTTIAAPAIRCAHKKLIFNKGRMENENLAYPARPMVSAATATVACRLCASRFRNQLRNLFRDRVTAGRCARDAVNNELKLLPTRLERGP